MVADTLPSFVEEDYVECFIVLVTRNTASVI